ncbi:gliding motility-associated C-terminal domain-containing protein [Taibaiella koreensis]|uniref:gliding motility-associated C-terminal domain-containing protein n=1 Tax=Taibaiella koreensis TaxID=1268548 RepID=UPI000E59C029|nr:gliding motility-associated C-terminal domain-containing protein [Taibaiella koreensis]
MKRLLFFLLLALNGIAARALHVAIVASLPYQMDIRWQGVASGAGYTTAIIPAVTLNNLSLLDTVDILVVSNAMGALSPTHVNTLRAFLQSGRSVYLQGEYLPTQPGNAAFAQLINSLGGSFVWGGVLNGNLNPSINGSLATVSQSVSTLPYFWYGCTASASCNCAAFMLAGGQPVGWQFHSPGTGRLLFTSDQDWVLAANVYPASQDLMRNILVHLADTAIGSQALPVMAGITAIPGDTVCAGTPVSFTASAVNAGIAPLFQWKKNGINTGSNSSSYTTAVLSNGDGISCVITPGAGCTGSSAVSNSIIMTVNPLRSDTQALTLCMGQLPYTWNGISVGVAGTAVASFTCPSVVTGCDSTTVLDLFTLAPVTAHDTLSLCPGQLPYTWNWITVTASGPAAATYTMASQLSGCDSTTILDILSPVISRIVDTTICSGMLPYPFGGQSCNGSGTFMQSFVSHAGCDSLVTLVLHVPANPVVSFSTLVSCGPVGVNGKLYIADTVVRDTLYTTYGCDSLYHSLQITIEKTRNDTLRATVCQGEVYWFAGEPFEGAGIYSRLYQTPQGCDSTEVLLLSVQALPDIRIQGPDVAGKLCAGDSLHLSVSGGSSYEWFDDGSFLGAGQEMSILLSAGDNLVRVKGKDLLACSNTNDLRLNAANCCRLQLPNAFSPNGDGLNDHFLPVSNAHPDPYILRIFNRWGRIVFAGTRIEAGWDGTVDGSPADAGTYYYRIEGRCTGDLSLREQGSFVLIR